MRILGLSSATKITSFGLVDEEKVLVESTMAEVQSERILFYVKEAKVDPKEIEAVAVAIGPGSYSGLRGAVATAKTLAQLLNVPLVGISTLEAIAYNLVDIEGTMAVILDARANEYNFALFGASSGKLKRLTEDLVFRFDHLVDKLSRITGKLYLVGNLREIKDHLSDKQNFHFAEELHSHPYGINVAKLGLMKIRSGKVDDPLTLAPCYSHKPNFQEYFREL
ncbi:MAG: tRNA (adenosine(37)-N6)-threonylcarbamoyltransferase complex dimerization subunit type 1 TsaB [Candidatus Margulisiibacteriota bacterium]